MVVGRRLMLMWGWRLRNRRQSPWCDNVLVSYRGFPVVSRYSTRAGKQKKGRSTSRWPCSRESTRLLSGLAGKLRAALQQCITSVHSAVGACSQRFDETGKRVLQPVVVAVQATELRARRVRQRWLCILRAWTNNLFFRSFPPIFAVPHMQELLVLQRLGAQKTHQDLRFRNNIYCNNHKYA